MSAPRVSLLEVILCAFLAEINIANARILFTRARVAVARKCPANVIESSIPVSADLSNILVILLIGSFTAGSTAYQRGRKNKQDGGKAGTFLIQSQSLCGFMNLVLPSKKFVFFCVTLPSDAKTF